MNKNGEIRAYPTVGSTSSLKQSFTNLITKDDLPTPTLPIKTTFRSIILDILYKMVHGHKSLFDWHKTIIQSFSIAFYPTYLKK